jgi:hypothetical protein
LLMLFFPLPSFLSIISQLKLMISHDMQFFSPSFSWVSGLSLHLFSCEW